jgi:hypothetical protein
VGVHRCRLSLFFVIVIAAVVSSLLLLQSLSALGSNE